MKISHTELDQCRVNPRLWVQAKATPGSSFRTYGYNQALIHAIRRFHKLGDDANSARQYLQSSLAEHFENQARSDQVLDSFDEYVSWCVQSAVVVADSKFRIKLDLGVALELRGEVHRLDIIQGGYRAVLLGDYPANWRKQLRMPLLQRAVASIYGRPVEEIEMGVQHLDGSDLVVCKYSSRQQRQAEREFTSLSGVVFELAGQFPGLL
jgi:hypothetical protein